MAYTYALINKETLLHICKSKKVSETYISNKTGTKPEKLSAWLDIIDPSLPTINQAKSVASCLHIPFAGLYMNPQDVPIKSIPSLKNLRTLYGSEMIDDSALNIAISDLIRTRDFLITANEELELQLPTFQISMPVTEDALLWANAIRERFSIKLEDQYRCSSSRKFYLYLRDKIESAGVFVHCFTDVPIEVARGISIYDDIMPIIGVNDTDRAPAKSFSMIHELVHIFKRESTMCNDPFGIGREEVFCNAVAGELLVPGAALSVILSKMNYSSPFSKKDIEYIAKKFSVSKEVIIRRLMDCKHITEVEYRVFADSFNRDIELEREERRIARQEGRPMPGPTTNVSRDAIDRTSSAVCRTLCYGYGNELYSKQDIARHLGISQKYVNKFLTEVSQWSN